MSDFEKVYKISFNTTMAQRNVKGLQTTIRNVERTAVVAGKKLDTYIGKRGSDAFKKVQRESRKAEAGIKRISKAAGRAGDKLRAFSQKWNRYVALPITLAGVASLKFARDFNKGMAKIATLIPGQTKRVQELKGEIVKLSTESGVSLGDLTEGVYAAISAWGDSADTMARMNVVVKASQAGYASTEETLNLLASITETYGDKTQKATEHLADMAFVANKLAIKAPFAEMASSMPKVASVAKSLNVTQEELFATLTAGAGVTGNVTEVSTQMRSLFVALTKETPLMGTVLKGLNKELGTNYKTVGEAIGNKNIGLQGFLTRLKGATSNSKEFQKALGGRVEGLNLALALTTSRADKYNEALTEMSTRSGQMSEAHKEVTDGVDKAGYTFDKMIARVKALSVRFGDALIPVISKLMDKYLEPLIKYIENMDDEAIDFYLTLGKWALILGVGSKLMTGLGSLQGLITGAGGAAVGAAPKIMSLAGAYSVLGAAIGGVTAGLMIHDMLVEPAAKKDYEAKLKAKDADLYARRVIQSAKTPEELDAAIQEVEKMESDVGGLTGGAAPTALYKATGYKSDRYKGLESTGKAKKELREARRKMIDVQQGMESYADVVGQAGFTGGGASEMYREKVRGQSVDNSINISLTAKGVVDPTSTKKVLRDAAKEIQRAGRSLAPAEL